MTDKTEWQEANRRLMAEQRRKLGDPPTAEEMLAYSRGELPENEQERIRDLLVANPDLARMYGAEFPAAPRTGDPDAVPDEQVAASFEALQQRLGGGSVVPHPRRRFRLHVPTTIAASLALLFFGMFVQAESRARSYQRQGQSPRVLSAMHELEPDGSRGRSVPTMLRKEGDAYLLRLLVINQVRYPHYTIELQEGNRVIWTNYTAQPDEDDAFLIVVPHGFLRAGTQYQLRIAGVDGNTRAEVAAYDVAVPAE